MGRRVSPRCTLSGFRSQSAGQLWLRHQRLSWQGHHPAWSSADVNGDPHSGSLKNVFSSLTPSDGELNFECLPASPGPYVESGYVWVDGAPGDTAYLWFFFYPDAACAAVSSTQAISASTSASQWTRLEVAGTAPAGTHSVGVSVVYKRGTTPTGSETAFADDLFSAPALALTPGRRFA